MIFAARYLPIENLSSPIRPKTERHQDHHLAACARLALPLPFIWLDRLLLALDGHPDAIQLENGRNVCHRSRVSALGQRFELIDPLIECAQSHTSLDRGAPLFLDLP